MKRVEGNRGVRWYSILGFLGFLTPLYAAFGQQTGGGDRFFQITVGLGVTVQSDPTILNYINYASSDQNLSGFSSASEFFITPEFQVNNDWSVGLEYSYLLKSYNSNPGDQWDFSCSVQMPTLIVHYLVQGDGYWLKIGGGIGAAFGNMTENYVQSTEGETFKASGPEMKVEAVGNTKFDEHFWGSIGVDLRWVYAGSFKGDFIAGAPTPKMDYFSVGAKFGITFQLY